MSDLASSEKPLTFLDPEIQKSPFDAYEYLREQAPVYLDPRAGMYIVTGYDDIREVLRDTKTFSSHGAAANARVAVLGDRQERVRRLYAEKGWPRTQPLGGLEESQHAELRVFFDSVLNQKRVEKYDPMIRDLAYGLVDEFAADGQCDIVSQFATQLPLRVLCAVVGAPPEAVPMIRKTADAAVKMLDMMPSEEEEIASVEREIELQHYFKRMIDELRIQPNDTVLSEFVNVKLPSGRVLTDAEFLMHHHVRLFSSRR